MRKRRNRADPESMGEQMAVRVVSFAPGEMEGQPLMLMRCVGDVHSKRPQKIITLGIPGGDVDAFLVAVQRGVATYKAHEAREGH